MLHFQQLEPFQSVSGQSTARWGALLIQNKFVSINQYVNEHTPHPAFTAPVKGLFYYFHKWYSAAFECTKRGMLCKNVNFDTDLLSPPSVLHVLSSESAFFRRPARTTPNTLWLLAKTLPWGTPRAILPHLLLLDGGSVRHQVMRRHGSTWRSRSHERFNTVRYPCFRQEKSSARSAGRR